jgi:ABC-2 type transport system permease protein
MSPGIERAAAVGRRVLRQLARDRRFLTLSLAVPLVVIYLMYIFFDAFATPFFEPAPLVVPVSAFIVHFLTYILCALVLVRERSAYTLQRMFVSGYRQPEIIAGYVLAYTALATLQSLLVLTEMSVLFRPGYGGGKFLSIYLVIWLLAVISISLGILVSNFARTEGQVFPFIPAVILPSILLSGVILPVPELPRWAQWLGHAMPLYWANRVIQRLIAPGGGLADDWVGLAGLPVYGVIVLLLATRTLREVD